jgi:hypothetical protein
MYNMKIAGELDGMIIIQVAPANGEKPGLWSVINGRTFPLPVFCDEDGFYVFSTSLNGGEEEHRLYALKDDEYEQAPSSGACSWA